MKPAQLSIAIADGVEVISDNALQIKNSIRSSMGIGLLESIDMKHPIHHEKRPPALGRVRRNIPIGLKNSSEVHRWFSTPAWFTPIQNTAASTGMAAFTGLPKRDSVKPMGDSSKILSNAKIEADEQIDAKYIGVCTNFPRLVSI